MEINIASNNLGISFDDNQINAEIKQQNQEIEMSKAKLDISFGKKGVDANVGTPRIVEKDHSKLDNLDYEHSGHTGFQPAGDYALRNELPTKLSDLENDTDFVEDGNYIHTDNNFTNEYKDKLENTNVYYGASTTSAGVQTKTVTCDKFQLKKGTILRVLFSNAQTYNGAIYLNVNNTGGKPVYRLGNNSVTRYYWQGQEIVDFVYDGSKYIMVRGGIATTTYYGITKLNSDATSTSQSEAATPYAVKQVYDLANEAYSIADEVHTDYYDTIITNGNGDRYLSDDGTYKEVAGGSGDIQIPDIRIQLKTNDNKERLLYLEFGKATQNFLNYVENNGVEIHLLKYIRQGKKIWGTEEDERGVRTKFNVKKWVHPVNHYEEIQPNQQCWGIRSLQRFEQYEGQIDDIISDADYNIPNDGIVQSEYILTYNDFKQGYKIIKLDDIMACIIKKAERSNEDLSDIIPYFEDGDSVRMIGCRVSSRRARQRQPIKFVFAIRPNGKLVYGDSNVALLELFKYRLIDKEGNPADKGYAATGILADIGYGVLIK